MNMFWPWSSLGGFLENHKGVGMFQKCLQNENGDIFPRSTLGSILFLILFVALCKSAQIIFMKPFNSFFFFDCSRGLDFHDNDLQFVTTSGASSNLENRTHGKLMSQK